MATKRKDKSRVVLKTGEVQRKDGTYQFSWQDSQMKRRFVYARTLDDLREKEKRIQKDKCDGIKTEARYTTIDELFDLWANMKRGLKNNTFENYKYMYNTCPGLVIVCIFSIRVSLFFFVMNFDDSTASISSFSSGNSNLRLATKYLL